MSPASLRCCPGILAGVSRQLPRTQQKFTASRVVSRGKFQSSSIASPSAPDKNALLRLINQHILASGPIPVPIWMNFCLNHPQLGYYSRTDRGSRKADPFGKAGDFITSPEITQVFGEAAKSPPRIRIIELGPGRGTLMADIVRRQNLKQDTIKENQVEWFDRIEQVGKVDDQWTMVIAHEFFDALPVHIFQKTEMGFREVMVDIDQNANTPISVPSPGPRPLRFVLSPGPTLASQTLVPSESQQKSLLMGSKLEISPSGHQIAKSISQILKSRLGGCGLVVDYGDDHYFSNSLRGFSEHQIVDPLFQPGLTDITTNVDFASLKRSMDPNSQ